MKATLIYGHRVDFDDGEILEIVVWRLAVPVEGCSHPYKYRLFYGRPGERLLGYDNEQPKGDYRHQGDCEQAYRFETPENLIDEFLREVEDRRAGR